MPVLATFAYQAGMTVMTLLFLRFVAASVMLTPLAVRQWRRHRQSMTWRSVRHALWIGMVIYTAEALTYFYAVKLLGGALAVMLLYLHPAMVAATDAVRMRQRPSVGLVVALLLSFLGLGMTVGPISAPSSAVGIILGLAAAVIYVAYTVVGHGVSTQIPTLVMSQIMFIGSAIGLGAAGWATGELRFDFAPVAWWWVMWLALAGSVVGIVFFFMAMLRIGTTLASLGSTLEAVVAVVVGAVVLGDVMTPWQYVGAVVLLGAAMIGMLSAPTPPSAGTVIPRAAMEPSEDLWPQV